MIVQNILKPAAIRHAIADLMTERLCGLSIAAAYVTESGSEIIRHCADRYITNAEFRRIPKLIITCFDFGLSEPEALQHWLRTDTTIVHVAGAQMVQRGQLTPSEAFHPKAYAFQTSAERANILVGSANLTGRGLSINAEAALALRDVPIAQVQTAFDCLTFNTTLLTSKLLDAYKALRRRMPPPRELAKEVARAPEPSRQAPADLEPLRDAIDAGNIHPSQFDQMWVQVEHLQGGSRNQLELPRGAHRFFGFQFDGYDQADSVVLIGRPVLVAGSRAWDDRPLTWHGNNRMERINLPTEAQGGFQYKNSAILFRRRPNGSSELLVAPWESDLSRSWREASRQTQQLFKLGRVGDRVVGFL